MPDYLICSIDCRRQFTHKLLIQSSGRKSKETRENYESILKRSQARFPDATLPDIVNFDSNIQGEAERQVSLDTNKRVKLKEKEVISFDQLHINAVHQRFVSAGEMKFLILVDKLLARRSRVTSKQINEFKKALTSTIQAEFPNYSLPEDRTHRENKMADLRELFRLKELRTDFTKESFEEARNKTREAHNFPAQNFQRIRPYDLFLQHVKSEGRWTSFNEVVQLWKQLPEDERSEFEEKAKRVKQEIADFEQNKLPQLLSDPNKFYWLLRVSFKHCQNCCNILGFGGEKVPF